MLSSLSVQSSIRRLQMTAQKVTPGSNMNQAGFFAMDNSLSSCLSAGDPITSLGKRGNLSLFHLDGSDSDYYFLVRGSDPKGERIGILGTNLKKNKVTGVFVIPSMRNKGLGTALYLAMIHTKGMVRSDLDFGTDACRTWKSISKYHTVKLIDNKTTKPVSFEWGVNAIPVVSGYPINEGPNIKRNFYFLAVK